MKLRHIPTSRIYPDTGTFMHETSTCWHTSHSGLSCATTLFLFISIVGHDLPEHDQTLVIMITGDQGVDQILGRPCCNINCK